MLLKVLSERKVKVLMEEQDIEKYALPFEKLNYEDPISRAFIYELINKIFEQTGIDYSECQVMIEVIPGYSRAYYILLTALNYGGKNEIKFDKSERSENDLYIFKINDAINVLRFIDKLKSVLVDAVSLFYYKRLYYLVLEVKPETVLEPQFSVFLLQMEEYGGRCRYHFCNEALLKEQGELLISKEEMHNLLVKHSI